MRTFRILHSNCSGQCKPRWVSLGNNLTLYFCIHRGVGRRKQKNPKKLKQMKPLPTGIIVCTVPPAQGNSTWEGLHSCTRYFCQFPHLLLTVWNADLIMQVVKMMAREMQGQVLSMMQVNHRVRNTWVACCASASAGVCWTLQRSSSPPHSWSWKPEVDQKYCVAAQSLLPGWSLGSLKM